MNDVIYQLIYWPPENPHKPVGVSPEVLWFDKNFQVSSNPKEHRIYIKVDMWSYTGHCAIKTKPEILIQYFQNGKLHNNNKAAEIIGFFDMKSNKLLVENSRHFIKGKYVLYTHHEKDFKIGELLTFADEQFGLVVEKGNFVDCGQWFRVLFENCFKYWAIDSEKDIKPEEFYKEEFYKEEEGYTSSFIEFLKTSYFPSIGVTLE